MKNGNAPTGTNLQAYNEAVINAYNRIVADYGELLRLYPTEDMRTYIVIESPPGKLPLAYSFSSPLVLLVLSCGTDDRAYTIAFAKSHLFRRRIAQYLETALIRTIYKHTAVERTPVNIEGCLVEYCHLDVDELKKIHHQHDSDDSEFTLITAPFIPQEA